MEATPEQIQVAAQALMPVLKPVLEESFRRAGEIEALKRKFALTPNEVFVLTGISPGRSRIGEVVVRGRNIPRKEARSFIRSRTCFLGLTGPGGGPLMLNHGFEFANGLQVDVGAKMGIPFGHFKAAVSKELRDDIEGHAFDRQPRGKGVAQGMEDHLVSGFLDALVEFKFLYGAGNARLMRLI